MRRVLRHITSRSSARQKDRDSADLSLNPETKAYTIDKYPETQFVTAIALRQNRQDVSQRP